MSPGFGDFSAERPRRQFQLIVEVALSVSARTTTTSPERGVSTPATMPNVRGNRSSVVASRPDFIQPQ
ncbi:MAG: hypothetical protein WKF84_03355 [Pyrinomonadaceae bacterium]